MMMPPPPPPRQPKHPQMILAVTVMHVLLVCNRIGTMGTTTDTPHAFLFQIGSYLSMLALAVSAVTFALLAIECTRKRIAKLVFIACIVLILLSDLGALVCYLIYSGGEGVAKNRKQLANLCSIVTGFSMLFCGMIIPLLFFCGPADLKSHGSTRSAEMVQVRPMQPQGMAGRRR